MLPNNWRYLRGDIYYADMEPHIGSEPVSYTHLVRTTEAGRANGTTNTLYGPYDGYAECVKVVFDEKLSLIHI